MDDFDWTSLTKRIAIKAELSHIYNAWTKSAELEKWFLEKADFYNPDKSLYNVNNNVIENSSYEWRWYLCKDPMIGTIKKVNGKDFIQFTFEGECLVDVHLTEKNGYTLVELKHYHIPTDDTSKHYIRIGCSNGWTFYLTNLKAVYEFGADLRNKDERLIPMINN